MYGIGALARNLEAEEAAVRGELRARRVGYTRGPEKPDALVAAGLARRLSRRK